MRAHTEATPCPAAVPSGHTRRVSFAQDLLPHTVDAADETENVDFTTEIRAQFRNAKPRRRASVMAGSHSFNPSMDIWQDVGREERSQAVARVDEGRLGPAPGARRQSILGKPAMRAPVHARKAMPAPADQRVEQTQESYRGSLTAQPARPRRVSGIVQGHTGSFAMPRPAERRQQSRRTSIMGGAHLPVVEESDRPHPLAQSEHARTQHWKDARRRTIWVPSDDTTVSTIHPGAQLYVPDDTWRRPRAQDTVLDLVTVSEEEPENGPPVQQQRGSRLSLAAKPRKGPLQLSRQQGGPNATIFEDTRGNGGGKENIPPGHEKVVKLDVKSGPADIVIHFDDARGWTDRMANSARPIAKPAEPTRLSHLARPSQSKPTQARQNIGMKRTGSSSLLETSPAAKSSKANHHSGLSARAQPSARTWTAAAADWHRDSRYNQPDTVTCNIDVHGALKPQPSFRASAYKAPVIAEDLACPELYEEHWLTHQEIAVTQLLNHLLSQSQPDSNFESDHSTLRRRMLRLHQDADTVALTKRVQASLQYGALAIPIDAIHKVARLETDIGMRREFLNLWLDTYNHDVLKAALETVVGRELVLPKRLSGASQTLTEREARDKLLKRGIERYMQTFLINHEDAVASRAPSNSIASIARHIDSSSNGSQGDGSQVWKWRRTVMKCLMLLLLLDRAKTAKVFTSCLFRRSSKHKSSTSVLHAFAALLLPSIGDISRSLAHMHFRLQVVQYPLEEYEYTIDNIAVDLRDGIVLARLVELLLFKPKAELAPSDATMTVALPTGEVLESLLNDEGTNAWLLSQHLKLPCIGRAQKLYNVQISLSALGGLNGGSAHIASAVTADDIVDGHREKTMGLLWALVSQSGLGLLIDEAGLAKELRRLEGERGDMDAASAGDQTTGAKKPREHLLQCWAAAVGRRHGVIVTNLTTSFADGAALEAIVAEYLHDAPAKPDPVSQLSLHRFSSSSRSLVDKLRAAGCSRSFVSLFASGHTNSTAVPTYPFSRSFTILTLSYLAARLLPLKATHRACLVLQRWYRARLAQRTASRRVRLMRLAHDCATVVDTRNRVVEAAATIQGAWKRVLQRRRDMLAAEVITLQAIIRGWRCRRSVCRQTRREGSVRARGGW